MAQTPEKVEKGTILIFTLACLGGAFGNLAQSAVPPMSSYIQAEFAVGVSESQLLTTVFMLVVGIVMPLSSFALKRWSLRNILLGTFVIQLCGAFFCGWAPVFPVLLFGRVLHAITVGIFLPLTLSIAMLKVPKNRQATALGFSGIAFGFCPNVGPTIGGAFAQFANWHLFFIVSAVITLILFAIGFFVVEKGQATMPEAKLDILSVALSSVGFGGVLVGLSSASSLGLANPVVWVPAVIGLVGVALFLLRQKKAPNPLVNLDIFNYIGFRKGFICLVLMHGSFLCITLLLPLFITQVWGGDSVQAGMAFLPSSVIALFANPLSGILSDKFGYRKILVGGYIGLAICSCSMIFANPDMPYWLILVIQAGRGLFVSLVINPSASWALAELPGPLVGDGSGFSSACRQLSASMASALCVFTVTTGAGYLGGNLTLAFQIAFGISAVMATSCLPIVIKYVKR